MLRTKFPSIAFYLIKTVSLFLYIGKGYKKAPLRGLDVYKAKNGR